MHSVACYRPVWRLLFCSDLVGGGRETQSGLLVGPGVCGFHLLAFRPSGCWDLGTVFRRLELGSERFCSHPHYASSRAGMVLADFCSLRPTWAPWRIGPYVLRMFLKEKCAASSLFFVVHAYLNFPGAYPRSPAAAKVRPQNARTITSTEFRGIRWCETPKAAGIETCVCGVVGGTGCVGTK